MCCDVKVEHSAISLGGAKEKVQEKTAEAHSLSAKVEILEKYVSRKMCE